ncbi:MAG TPA: hypothetical protein VIN03_19500 [Roseateles sp.]
MRLLRYFRSLSLGKTVLWCYLIWYLSTVATYFDPSPALWLNSIGISVIVGVALLLSVGDNAGLSWQTFRLFFMPFAVSSFAALIKGRGFLLVFPPSLAQAAVQLGACAGFLVVVWALKRLAPLNPG